MKENYIQDEQYMQILRKFVALAFVEILDAYDAFKMISQELIDYNQNDDHQNFISYFDNTWMG